MQTLSRPLRRLLQRHGAAPHPGVGAAFEAAVTGFVVDFVGHVLAGSGEPSWPTPMRSTSGSRRRSVGEATKTLLCASPGNPHRIGHVAAAVGVSPFHLAHVFRAHSGLPLRQYLLRLRMARSLARLGAGETNLSRLALDLGFSSHSHFTTLFHRHFGVGPAAVRRSMDGARAPNVAGEMESVTGAWTLLDRAS
jgi:AraC-like DNA-binding protein